MDGESELSRKRSASTCMASRFSTEEIAAQRQPDHFARQAKQTESLLP